MINDLNFLFMISIARAYLQGSVAYISAQQISQENIEHKL